MSSIKSPLVSIIMNCHNGEKYLNTSIKSILSQSYNNWELIFWDNNSQDNSKKILLKYKDKRIKYFKSKKLLKLYQYHSKTAKHYFCSVCGIYTHHKPRSNPNSYCVNAACLEGVNPFDLKDVPIFDGINHPHDKK